MDSYQVRVEKHWGGKNYNVSLVSWEKNGSGMTSGRAFDVPYKKAMKEAYRQSELYNAPIKIMWENDNE